MMSHRAAAALSAITINPYSLSGPSFAVSLATIARPSPKLARSVQYSKHPKQPKNVLAQLFSSRWCFISKDLEDATTVCLCVTVVWAWTLLRKVGGVFSQPAVSMKQSIVLLHQKPRGPPHGRVLTSCVLQPNKWVSQGGGNARPMRRVRFVSGRETAKPSQTPRTEPKRTKLREG